MTQEDAACDKTRRLILQQIETLMRVGCAALQQQKPLEESQQIGATTLQLIETLRTMLESE